jgi:hypothetical protein
MRKIWVVVAFAVLVGGLTSAQAVGKDRTARESKRMQLIRDFRASARGQALQSGGGVARASGDFNKDGKKDLVVGVPGEDGAGAVQVFYGGKKGLKTGNDQVIRLTGLTGWCAGVAGGGAAGSNFGAAVATGDFNKDGATDIAVGAPNYSFGGPTNDGLVFLFYGHAGGPFTPATDCQFIDQAGTISASDGDENDDHFGASLAAGNFGGSAHTDLAIGIPGEDVGALSNAGAVAVVYGSSNGLTIPLGPGSPGPQSATTPQYFTQNTSFVEGVAEANDAFGFSLDAGNLGHSSQADLAIGVPGESVGEIASAGAVNVLYGSAAGLSVVGDQLWTQDSEGVKGVANEADDFGFSLAIGNFGKSGKADLAVGVVFEDGVKALLAGAVQVLYGGSGGLSAKGNQLWSQDSPGIPDAGEPLDAWGWALAAGDVGKNGKADLVVGAPLETPKSKNFGASCPGPRGCAGQITVIYGSKGGLKKKGAKIFNQDSSHVPDSAEVGDEFGFSLAVGNYGKSSKADVVVGVPFEDIGATVDAGAINELFGTSTGLTGSGAKFFRQGANGVEDTAEANDHFGYAAG